MKTIIRLIVCLLLLVGWGLAALSLHVIRTPDAIPITLVTKERLGITDTYVDTRTWTLNDVSQHPALVQKLISVNKADVLRHIVTDARPGDVTRQLSDALQRAPQKEPREKPAQPPTAAQAARSLWGLF